MVLLELRNSMPIYEYRCNHCKKRVTLLILSRSTQARCSHCGGSDLTKLLSRFAAPKSEEARMESLSDPGKWGGIGDDLNKDVEPAAEEAARGAPAEGGPPPPESPEAPES